MSPWALRRGAPVRCGRSHARSLSLLPTLVVVACGQADLPREAGVEEYGAPAVLSSAPVSTSDMADGAPPSDLALALGGQTGSEFTPPAQNLPTSLDCSFTTTRYARSANTPLGFAGDAIRQRLVAQQYRYVAPGAAVQSAELVFSVGDSVTYYDRSPTLDGKCPDAVLVPLSLEIAIGGERVLSNIPLDLFAASPDSFAGYTFVAPVRTEGQLASPSLLLVLLEASDEQIVLWLYRGSTEGELMGRLIAP